MKKTTTRQARKKPAPPLSTVHRAKATPKPSARHRSTPSQLAAAIVERHFQNETQVLAQVCDAGTADLKRLLEVELHGELDEPGQQNLGRLPEPPEGFVLFQHRVIIQYIEDIGAEPQARPAESQDLREGQV